jgi:hypothetical protein
MLGVDWSDFNYLVQPERYQSQKLCLVTESSGCSEYTAVVLQDHCFSNFLTISFDTFTAHGV